MCACMGVCELVIKCIFEHFLQAASVNSLRACVYVLAFEH